MASEQTVSIVFKTATLTAKTNFAPVAVAFGAIKTRLTQAPTGEYVVRPDGSKHAVGFSGGYDEEEKWLASSLLLTRANFSL